MPTYNGHKNWNHWNVSLWLSNDETLYRRVRALKNVYGSKGAALRLLGELPTHTPDGATYSMTAVLAAVRRI